MTLTGSRDINITAAEKKLNVPFHFGSSLFRANISLFVLCSVLDLLGLPMAILSTMMNLSKAIERGVAFNEDRYFNGNAAYLMIALFAAIAALLTGAYAALTSFSHLYSKQKVDMELSLPLSANQRFISGYFSGLAVYMLPYIGAQIISVILMLTGHGIFDGKVIGSEEEHITCNLFAEYIPLVIKVIFGVMLIMIMFYTLWVLTMTFCGSKLEVNIYGTLANFVMPALYIAFLMMINKTLCGAVTDYYITADSGNILGMLFLCTSPIGMTAALAEDLTGYAEQSFRVFAMHGAVFTAICFFAALYVYRRRKAEDTGKSFAVKGFYHFVMTCMIYLTVTIVMCVPVSAPLLVGAGAAYVIMDCISARSVKKLVWSAARFIGIAAACAAVFTVCDKTGYFGAEYTVPAVSEVQSAYIEYDSGGMGGGLFQDRHGTPPYDMTFSSEEALQIITDTHRTELDVVKKYDLTNNSYSSNGDFKTVGEMTVRYELKNGSKLLRHYDLFSDDAAAKLVYLENTEEYKELMISDINEYFCGTIKTDIPEDVRISPINTARPKELSFNSKFSAFPEDLFGEEFAKAVTEDIRDLTLETNFRSEIPLFCTLQLGKLDGTGYMYSDLSMNITGEYKNTVEYFKNHGVDLQSVYTDALRQELYDEPSILIEKGTAPFKLPVNNRYIDLPVEMTVFNTDSSIYRQGFSDEHINDHFRSYYKFFTDIKDPSPTVSVLQQFSDEDRAAFEEIVLSSYQRYLPYDDCYIIDMPNFSRTRFAVPHKYDSTIERLIEKYGEEFTLTDTDSY